jgi:hypothetical protein
MSKERLVDLIGNAPIGVNGITLLDKHSPKVIEEVAAYLLANGVIVPPCKVGQILYVIEAGLINEAKVKEYKYCSNSNNGVHWHIVFEDLFAMSEAHIGKSVFYTREEAEKALEDKKYER